jgi:hypothetical protein
VGLLLLGLGRRRRFAGGAAAQRLFGGRLVAVSEGWAIQDLFEGAANFFSRPRSAWSTVSPTSSPD